MAYRRGLTTDRAIDECFQRREGRLREGISRPTSTRWSRRSAPASSEEKPIKFSQLERQLKEKPDDPDLNARMAYEHFARRDYKEARPVRRQGAEAQAAPSPGQLRQGPAARHDRRRGRGARSARARARPASSPTSE